MNRIHFTVPLLLLAIGCSDTDPASDGDGSTSSADDTDAGQDTNNNTNNDTAAADDDTTSDTTSDTTNDTTNDTTDDDSATESSETGEPMCVEAPANNPGIVVVGDAHTFPEALDFGFVRFSPGWGDFAEGPHGTIGVIGPNDETPAHTHTGAYSGVVIRGTMTNPFGTEVDPPMMEAGSFWHVPAGEQHVTRCVSDQECWFYLYADGGFDFTPIDALTEPPSADARVVTADDVPFVEVAPFVSFGTVEGDFETGPHGSFGRFPAEAAAPAHIHSGDYYGVTISDGLINPYGDETDPPALVSGSIWTVPGDAPHVTACESDEDCLFFLHAMGGFDFAPICR